MNAAENAFVPHVGWLAHEPGDELIWLLRQGYFEAAEQAFFWLYLRSGDWFFDCGAHIGLYSVIASRATNGEVHIFSVEASEITADYLERNLRQNNVHCDRVFRRALWSTSGDVPFASEGSGKSAYAHVAFDDGSDFHRVQAVTMDELVSLAGADEISLVKIDVEGAELEALEGAQTAIARNALPLIMIEFTERNLRKRGASSNHLATQLNQLGYELCEVSPAKLELVSYRIDGPIWYKNLFACVNRNRVNLRLNSAKEKNRNVARDILERARACSRFKEFEDLDRYRSMADKAEEFHQWAKNTEQLLVQEKGHGRELRTWAENAEARLAQEKGHGRELRTWAENAEARLAQEKEHGRELRTWAENAEARVKALNAELAPLRAFANRLSWLYDMYLKRLKNRA